MNCRVRKGNKVKPGIIIVLSGVLICFTSMNANAQNRFFNEGQSGATLGGRLATGEDYTKFGADFIYTVSGRFDIYIGAGRSSYSGDEFGEDYSSTSFPAGLGIAVFRPSETFNGGMDFKVGYVHDRYSRDFPDDTESEMTGNTYSAGMELYLKANLASEVQILPVINVSYAQTSFEIEHSSGYIGRGDVEDALIMAGATLMIKGNFAITPSFTTFNDSRTWGINFQYIF